jgi:hypothetical protein
MMAMMMYYYCPAKIRGQMERKQNIKYHRQWINDGKSFTMMMMMIMMIFAHPLFGPNQTRVA